MKKRKPKKIFHRSPVPPPSEIHKDKRQKPRAKTKEELQRSWKEQ